MTLDLERKIIIEKRDVSDGSHPWCLKEIGLDETQHSERWVPARGTYYFTASSIALNSSLSNDSDKNNSRQNFLDEVIVAKLYPGILRHGSLQDDYRFSALGTNHHVEVFKFYLKSHEGSDKDNSCSIRNTGGRDHTRLAELDLEIHLSLPIDRFNLFRQMIIAKAVDAFELILTGVSGFYKDEFSISLDRKILTKNVGDIIKAREPNKGNNEFNPENIGKVREWDISLEHQMKLEKFNTFANTDLSGNPSVDDRYIERTLKPHLQGLQERAEQQARSDLHSVITRTAKNVAEYSNSVNESRLNYKRRLADAIDVVKSIQSAINLAPKPEPPRKNKIEKKKEIEQTHTQESLWDHGNLEAAYQGGWESSHQKKIDKTSLEHEAVRYLQRPWMWDDQLEWVMIDSLMFCEIIEFGERIKQNLPEYTGSRGTNTAYFSAKGNLKKMLWAKRKYQIVKSVKEFFFVVVLPLSLISYFWNLDYQDIIFWGGGLYIISMVLYAITKIVRGLDENHLDADHEARYSQLLSMRNVYAELNTGVINPSYLRGRLLDTASKGAIWSGAVFALIDNVIERSPIIWTHQGDPYIAR